MEHTLREIAEQLCYAEKWYGLPDLAVLVERAMRLAIEATRDCVGTVVVKGGYRVFPDRDADIYVRMAELLKAESRP